MALHSQTINSQQKKSTHTYGFAVSLTLRLAMPPKPKAEPPQPAENTGPYWIQVKYGKDQMQLFNSDCLATLLADHIKAQCAAHIDEDIDLQKEDKSMVGLRDAAGEGGEGRASKVLAAKGVYYLCKLVVSAEGDGSAPVPELLFEEADAELEGAPVEE